MQITYTITTLEHLRAAIGAGKALVAGRVEDDGIDVAALADSSHLANEDGDSDAVGEIYSIMWRRSQTTMLIDLTEDQRHTGATDIRIWGAGAILPCRVWDDIAAAEGWVQSRLREHRAEDDQ